MDKINEREVWEEECERLLGKRLGLTPPEISDTYAVLRTAVIVNHRNMTKRFLGAMTNELEELDRDWYRLLSEAERVYYRMGFEDAIRNLNE